MRDRRDRRVRRRRVAALKMNALEIERSLPCTYCGSKAGERCRTISGRVMTFCHASRWWAAKDAGLLPAPVDLDKPKGER
jgi:hypothetical protein